MHIEWASVPATRANRYRGRIIGNRDELKLSLLTTAHTISLDTINRIIEDFCYGDWEGDSELDQPIAVTALFLLEEYVKERSKNEG